MSNNTAIPAESAIATLLRKEPHWLLRWGTALLVLLLLIIAGIAMMLPWKVSHQAEIVRDSGAVIWVKLPAAENTSVPNGSSVTFISGGNLKPWKGTVQAIGNSEGVVTLKIKLLSPGKRAGERISGKGKIIVHQTLVSRLST
ncbi:MAG TPA: hypothetical protein VM802_23440 [Chitinophaga sp.]|uniref:hypothetical protein n=1 Tax=Chitinophaga sp. TaxID=1869181 RepID=UPI002BB8B618|nr:hypothetical protein [Chitinophaga sp.]HVI47843.1 hypothetical protein [Chitinophaga sp.]